MSRTIKKIRYPVVAGSFYPDDPAELYKMIEKFLSGALLSKTLSKAIPTSDKLKILIVPHAGYIYSGPVAATGYKLLQALGQTKYYKILLIGLSHHIPFIGAATSTDDYWETPIGKVSVEDIRLNLPKQAKQELIIDLPEAHEQEHSLEVQLPFLQMTLKKFTIYPLALSDVSPEQLAILLTPFCKQPDVITIISSDLSHFYPYNEAKKIDEIANRTIPSLDIKTAEKQLNACNKAGILTAMYIAKNLRLHGYLIDYKNSGDTAGDKSSVVGYGCYAFYI